MIALAAALASCNTTPPSTRYFRVVYPTTFVGYSNFGVPLLPDACYQAVDLPAASTSQQQAAETFCQVPKAQTRSGGSNMNVLQQESWTLLDLGEDKFALERTTSVLNFQQGPTPVPVQQRSALQGRTADHKFLFEATQRTWAKQCPTAVADGGFGPQVILTACKDKCINTRSDPNNCGDCGRVCAQGLACQFGNCTNSCGGQFFQFCDGGQVEVGSDPRNCGFCGNVCPAGTICTQGFGGGPKCSSPCDTFCGNTSIAEGCGTPVLMNKDLVTSIDFELKGAVVVGNLTQATVYSCVDPGCAADYAARCPNCTIQNPVSGRESTQVQETEQR